MNIIRAGRAVVVRDRRMGTHLWFVLTDPDPLTGLVVMVALVTERPHTEKTVRLDAGDHSFVRHASNVDFGTARFAPSSKLSERLGRGVATLDADMSAGLLEQVCRGLLASSHTINEIAAYCRENFRT